MDEQPNQTTLADFGGVLRYPLVVWMLIDSLVYGFAWITPPVTPRPIHASGRVSWDPDDWPDHPPPNRSDHSAT
jgi:hypothetical protein